MHALIAGVDQPCLQVVHDRLWKSLCLIVEISKHLCELCLYSRHQFLLKVGYRKAVSVGKIVCHKLLDIVDLQLHGNSDVDIHQLCRYYKRTEADVAFSIHCRTENDVYQPIADNIHSTNLWCRQHLQSLNSALYANIALFRLLVFFLSKQEIHHSTSEGCNFSKDTTRGKCLGFGSRLFVLLSLQLSSLSFQFVLLSFNLPLTLFKLYLCL